MHYSLMVVGRNHDDQLAPFNMNESGRDPDRRKWDWYVVGGRWRGFFKLKDPGAPGAVVGVSGVAMNEAKAGHADVVRKRDIDWEGMRADAQKKARKKHRTFEKLRAGRDVLTWDEVTARVKQQKGEPHHNWIDRVREQYWGQSVLQDMRKDKEFTFRLADEFLRTEDEFALRYMTAAGLPWAMLTKSGEWHERKDNTDESLRNWRLAFDLLLSAVPEWEWLTLVDCHC